MVLNSLYSLCLEIVDGYVRLDEEHQQRNIIAWRPTLVEILDGFVSFSDADVNYYEQELANDYSFQSRLNKCIQYVSRLLIGIRLMKSEVR